MNIPIFLFDLFVLQLLSLPLLFLPLFCMCKFIDQFFNRKRMFTFALVSFPCMETCSNISFIFIDELLAEKEKYKGVSDELDMTLNELSGY